MSSGEKMQSKYENSSMFRDILQQMDVAAFKWDPEGFFYPLYDFPEWFHVVYTDKVNHSHKIDRYYLGHVFPFIENFLFDAKKIWEAPKEGRLYSGLWTEIVKKSDEEIEFYLEAVAINTANIPILLLVNETSNYDVRHKVFQTARNIALQNEQLENVVKLHQRQLKQQLERFYHQKRSFEELAENVEQESSAVLILSQDGGVEVYNKALIDIYSLKNHTELPRESLLDKWMKEAERLYPEIYRVLEVGGNWEGEFETFDAANQKKWIRLIISPMKENDGVSHYICIANDISESKVSYSEIEKVSQFNALTRLPNRRNFWGYLAEKIDEKKLQGGNLFLLYVDLDHFKQINDDLGPEQADFLLTTVATRLKRCVKSQDYVAHLGADEFAIIVTQCKDNSALADIAKRVIASIYQDVSFNELTLNVSASVGIAVYPQHGANAREIVKSADYAMYHAKEMGRNQYHFYGPNTIRGGVSKLHIEQGLKHAIENGEFELFYQPQICTGSSTVHRAEALIRWNHPTHGVILPSDFIYIAEGSSLILDIGRWVIMTACKELHALTDKGLNVKISINVSPKQFKYSNLINDLVKGFDAYSINPNQLELEVTESTFMSDMDNVIAQLEEIRALGVSISLDDFGTGYSSLSYLNNLPSDQLKIDRAFIQGLPENNSSKKIVESLIKLAHDLSIEVIAEGVENQQQLDYLKKLQCDYFQGYLFHAPLNAKELVSFYKESLAI